MQYSNSDCLNFLKKTVATFVCGLASSTLLYAQPEVIACELAITNVHVVTMADEGVLRNRVVRIAGGVILGIDSEQSSLREECAETLDGEERYLLPGLVDTHIHLMTNAFAQAFQQSLPEVDFEAALAPYTAHGITGVRVMSGAPDILSFRDRSSSLLVPRLVVASRMLSGTPPILPEPITEIVLTAADARNAVREAVEAGYDFIKVRDNLDTEVFSAILAEAHTLGTYVDGHINRNIGPLSVLSSAQDAIAHLDELAIDVLTVPRSINDMVEAVAACDCVISTGIGVSRNVSLQVSEFETLAERPEMKYADPFLVGAFWMPPNNPYLAEGAPSEFFENVHAVAGQLLVALVEIDAALVAGSDALNPMLIPGVSLHDELQQMVELGLSPYQALRTATSAVADHVPDFENTGVIEVGRYADAVLVDDNPLDDLSVLRRPRAVIVGGEVLYRTDLDALLNLAATEIRQQ